MRAISMTCSGEMGKEPIILKTLVKPQRHREHRGKTKHCSVAGTHPSGELFSADNSGDLLGCHFRDTRLFNDGGECGTCLAKAYALDR